MKVGVLCIKKEGVHFDTPSGSMYPYFRVNEFLTRYENFNETSRYKIIVFYPGQQDGNTFRLFGLLPDTHTYRANLLLND